MLKVQLQAKREPIVLYCSIRIPHEIYSSLCLNSDNRGGQGLPTNTQRINLTSRQIAQLVNLVRNACDGQFTFENFDYGKDGESGFWSEVKGYNESHDKPITEDTIIEAIKKLSPRHYKQSKVAQTSFRPTIYDGGVFHEWKLPLSYVFKEDTQQYDKRAQAHGIQQPDLIYLKLFFTDDAYDQQTGTYTMPSGNGPIRVASFHRDSDSVIGSGASWSTDARNPQERRRNRAAGEAGLRDARRRRAEIWKKVEEEAAKKAADEIEARKKAEEEATKEGTS